MATVKLLLKKNKQKANGEFPLYLRITEAGKPKYISLGISLLEKQWDDKKESIRSHPNKSRYNAKIAKVVSEAQNISIEQELRGKTVTSSSIKNKLIGKSSNSFSIYFEKYLQRLEQEEKMGTLDKASAVYRKFKTYNKSSEVLFNQINYSYLEEYETYLREVLGNSQNTIHSNLKIFRMLFNKAVLEGLIDLDQNPFLKYKLKTEKTTKEFLTSEELKRLEDLVIDEKSTLYHHRNMFVFACYAGGIRISDVLQLKWKNFNQSHILITMQKTREQISIKLPKKALEIIEFYGQAERDNDHFIFPFLKPSHELSKRKLFQVISSRTAYVNKDLKRLALKAKIEKRVSFHTSRHTYATLALSLGMPMPYVSKLMGHSNIKVTQQYAKLINKDLDDAMEVFNQL